MSLTPKTIILLLALIAVLAGSFFTTAVRAQSDPFPVYPCLQPNIEFWTRIYTQYSSEQGVLHDSRNLNQIYGVIELVDPDGPGGRKINQNRIKTAKKKYQAILEKLMRAEPPSGPLEEQVAGLFGPDTRPEVFRSAIRHMRCQVGQKDRFREGVIRSGAYIEDIKRIFREHGLPEDLAYLPHVESSFNTKAYSKFGAAGIWQFTRSTGRHYLRVEYAVDERRDPILSSQAAAKLLRHNYRKLENWPLALTAYNHGVAGMLRALRKKGSYERIFEEYRSRIFRFASRNFYSEFLAAREAAENYRQYFGDLKLDAPVKSREVELAAYVSLPQVARHLDLDISELARLNPALRHPVINGQKYVPQGYRLRLPHTSDTEWESLIAELEDKLYKQHQRTSRIYTVQRGDTAGEIARIHGVKLEDLIAANNLNPRATIYVDQTLRIPLPDEAPVQIAMRDAARRQAKNAGVSSRPQSGSQVADIAPPPDARVLLAERSASGPENPERISPVSAAEKESESAAGRISGRPESKPAIASEPSGSAENQLDPALIAEVAIARGDRVDAEVSGAITALTTARLDPGDVAETPMDAPAAADLPEVIPQPASSSEKNAVPLRLAVSPPLPDPQALLGNFGVERVWNQNGKTVGLIRVEVEETLGHYAEWLGVAAQEIRRLNGFKYGRVLQLHQKVKIPLHRVTKEAFEENRFEYHQELAEDFFAAYRIEKVLTYSIKRGDNIWTLSREEFEVPLWLIKRFNSDVDFNALVPSQKLLIPIVEKNV